MTIPNRETPQAAGERGRAKAKYARFLVPVLRWMVLAVALCSFVLTLADIAYGERHETGMVVAVGAFLLASLTLWAMTPKPALGNGAARQLQLSDWWLVTYFAIIGLGFNWVCAFLWFSRRYAFFSIPVIGVTVLTMVLYAAVALLVARLTGKNWRRALLVFLLVPGALAGIVLRLGLLR